ncbi:MAG: hypothetical protein HPY62_11435 [Bacteroidales bacterium]|nr:hypothetical protein [Bacteroidales bacterium]
MYYIAEDLKFIDSQEATLRRKSCQELINGISSLMNYLKSSKK